MATRRTADRTARFGDEAGLARHLADVYGIDVVGTQPLDVRVLKVDRAVGSPWVARALPADRALSAAREDAAILSLLAQDGFPAERPAAPEPISVLDDQAVVVTEFVEPVPRTRRRQAIVDAGGLRALGGLLGRLHGSAAGAQVTRPGGAWHHLADGAPAEELRTLRRLVGATTAPSRGAGDHAALVAAVDGLADGDGLPEALVHPDFVMANVVAAASDGRLVVVDWVGAGRGPRAWALGFTLWSVGFGGDLARVDRLAAGYRAHVRLEPQELDALAALVRVRPILFTAWAYATGRRPLGAAAEDLRRIDAQATAIAARARTALTA